MTATVGSEVAEAGDEVARLYARHAPRLRRFCLGRLRSSEDADDAVQTVFLRVYTALRGGTVPVYEAAWLYKIAHNVCLSRIESGAARARVERPQDLDALQDVLAAPGERRDELVGLAEALAAMPPNLRQAILLREWQGLSYAEIAEALGVSVSAVETLIFRARRHLASALERGVAAPARSVTALLQLSWLLRRLRTLLASGRGAELGAVKLTATAVVAAAVAGGGVATGVLASRGSAPAPAVVLPAPAAASTAAVAGARTTAGRSGPVAVAPRRHVTRTASPLAGRARTVADPPAGGAPTVDAPRGAPAPAPTPPSVTTAAVATISPGVTAPTVSTPVGLPATPTSTAVVPTVTVPTVTVPTTPTVQVPTVSVPTVPVPTVTAPAVTTPTVSLPVTTLAATTVTLPTPPLP